MFLNLRDLFVLVYKIYFPSLSDTSYMHVTCKEDEENAQRVLSSDMYGFKGHAYAPSCFLLAWVAVATKEPVS
jgi:hypothetical protein